MHYHSAGNIFKNKHKLIDLIVTPCFLLFTMMLFLPTAYTTIKIVLMTITIVVIVVKIIITREINLHKKTIIWLFIWLFTNLFFLTIGVYRGNPGAIKVGTVEILWPIVYTIYIAGISNEKIIIKLFKVMIFATFLIGAYTLVYILTSYGLIPSFLYIKLDLGQNISFSYGELSYAMNNIATLIFLVPFLVTIQMAWPSKIKSKFSKSYVLICLLMGLILTVISGLRSLMLTVAISPLIVFVLNKQNHKKLNMQKKKHMFLSTLLIGIIILLIAYFFIKKFFDLSLLSYIESFKNGFKFNEDVNAIARKEQFQALLRGWAKNPFFGAGSGAAVIDSIRSYTQAWAYELSYVSLLFNKGLVGITIYVSQLYWIYKMSGKILKSSSSLRYYMLPIIVGTTCFLIGNATNPYLAKYDFMWVVFLPIGVINAWLIEHKDKI